MHTVTITGRLGLDPQLRHSKNQVPMARLRVASAQFYAGSEETVWFTVFLHGKDAQSAARALVRGQRVSLTGDLRVRYYVDNQGQQACALEVFAHRIEFLDRPLPKKVGADEPELWGEVALPDFLLDDDETWSVDGHSTD